MGSLKAIFAILEQLQRLGASQNKRGMAAQRAPCIRGHFRLRPDRSGTQKLRINVLLTTGLLFRGPAFNNTTSSRRNRATQSQSEQQQ